MTKYDPAGNAKHLVYINICFDDWVGYFTDAYLSQINEYIEASPVPACTCDPLARVPGTA